MVIGVDGDSTFYAYLNRPSLSFNIWANCVARGAIEPAVSQIALETKMLRPLYQLHQAIIPPVASGILQLRFSLAKQFY